jgi:ATP-binding cassette, subfamily B, bacterial
VPDDDEGMNSRSPVARLLARPEIGFLRALPRASRAYAYGWLALIVIRGTLPALVSLGSGWLVGSVQDKRSIVAPLVLLGVVFVALLVSLPVHQAVGMNLGSRMANSLYERLMAISLKPDGIGHLEQAEFTNDLTMARDFDLGMMGPPLEISMDFIAGGLYDLVAGFSAAILVGFYAWWAPIVLIVGWGATHWLLRESGVWKDRNTDEVQTAQRHAEYAYRLAVDAASSKELRMFGIGGWVIDRFVTARTKLYQLQFDATRLREKSVLGALALALGANALVFWQLGNAGSESPARSCSCKLQSVCPHWPSAD